MGNCSGCKLATLENIHQDAFAGQVKLIHDNVTLELPYEVICKYIHQESVQNH